MTADVKVMVRWWSEFTDEERELMQFIADYEGDGMVRVLLDEIENGDYTYREMFMDYIRAGRDTHSAWVKNWEERMRQAHD